MLNTNLSYKIFWFPEHFRFQIAGKGLWSHSVFCLSKSYYLKVHCVSLIIHDPLSDF